MPARRVDVQLDFVAVGIVDVEAVGDGMVHLVGDVDVGLVKLSLRGM